MRGLQLCLLLPLLVLASTPGCASKKPPKTEIERLWEAGYGFNNPNARRDRGTEPIPFTRGK